MGNQRKPSLLKQPSMLRTTYQKQVEAMVHSPPQLTLGDRFRVSQGSRTLENLGPTSSPRCGLPIFRQHPRVQWEGLPSDGHFHTAGIGWFGRFACDLASLQSFEALR